MDIERFESGLEEVVGRPTELRPFVCSGNPLDCSVFVVGINPASPLRESLFWDYWSSTTGFDRSAWLAAYVEERLALGREQGKRKQRFSATRNRIERFVQEVAPLAVLETNVFSRATPSASELTAGDRNTAIFDYLLQAIEPRLLIVHGEETATAVRGLESWKRLSPETWFFPHFASRSGAWNKEKVVALAAKAKAFLEGG